jgi:hypothetical protein
LARLPGVKVISRTESVADQAIQFRQNHTVEMRLTRRSRGDFCRN